MDKHLRQFLEANGLAPAATDAEASEHQRKLAAEGIVYTGPFEEKEEACHAERSEASPATNGEILRGSAPQNDSHAATIADTERMVAEAIRKDRARVEEIRSLCKFSGVPEATQRQWIDSGMEVDAARKAVLDHMMKQNPPMGAAATTSRASVGVEDHEKFRAAAVDGIMMQVGMRKEKHAPGAEDFRGMTPMGVARLCLERAGVNTAMMGNIEIAERALIPHSTSDFPTLLGGIGKESLSRGYQESVQQTWRQFAETTTASDFRDIYNYDFVGAFDLKLVRENAEYETVDAGEAHQRYRMRKYGRIFPYTIEMLMNDRWGVFESVPRRFGAGAARLENNIVYDLFAGGQALLEDGIPLFDPSRGNVMPGAPLSEATLKEAIRLLRAQRGPAGEYLDLQPAILLVSPLDEFNAAILINSTGNVGAQLNAGVINPLYGIVRVIADPRIADGAWYVLAAPSQAPLIQVATPSGQNGPEILENIDFMTDGIQIKARHIFGAGLMGWIGAIYNPGQ